MYILLAIILSFNVAAQSSDEQISFAYGDHNSAPYTEYDKDKNLTGGYFLDVAKFVGRELNIKYKMIYAPRTRMLQLLKSGHIDIYCSFNKAWVKNPEDFFWYQELFKDANLLYTNIEEYRNIKSFNEINEKIGTITGFSYHPEFKKLIARVGRYDLRSHEILLHFLELKRIGMIIMSKNITEQYLKDKPLKLFPVTDFKDSFDYGCIISKKIQIDRKKLYKALDKYKATRSKVSLGTHQVVP